MKKTILILLTLVGFGFILSEFIPLSFYKSYGKRTTSVINHMHIPDSLYNRAQILINEAKSQNHYRIKFHGLRSDSLAERGAGKRVIDVYVRETTSLGLGRYFPLIKLSGFKSNVEFGFGMDNHTYFRSSVQIKGHSNVYGICSVKQAEAMIIQQILESQLESMTNEVIEKIIVNQLTKEV